MSTNTPWIKASASNPSGACVQMRRFEGLPEVRDSKNTAGPVLRMTSAGVRAWLEAARSGEFDELAH